MVALSALAFGGAVTNLVKWHKRYTTQEQAVAAPLKAGINQFLGHDDIGWPGRIPAI